MYIIIFIISIIYIWKVFLLYSKDNYKTALEYLL